MRKRLFTLLTATFLFAVTLLHAQAPQGINYQAVVRDGSGSLLANASVTMRFTIHQNTTTGTTVYQETQNASTNAYGLVTAVIGSGTPVTGTLSAVDWGSDTYFLQVEVNPGSGYADLGTTQFQSVPYALSSADGNWTVSGSNINNSNVGNVGIGTASPGAGLVVSGSGLWKSAIGIENTTSGIEWRMNVSGSDFAVTKITGSTFSPFKLLSTGDVGFSNTMGNSTLYILDNGNVGIGTTTPAASLHVTNASDPAALVGLTGGILSYLTVNQPSTVSSTAGIFRCRDDGSSVMYVDKTSATYQLTVYGDAYASGGTWTNSDRNLKHNITTLNNVLPDLMKLKPVSYYFDTQKEEYKYLNLPDEKQFGLLAQEVKQIFPNMVRETVQYDENGKPRPQSLHTMNYTELIPILIEGIQEQQQQIQELKNQIDELKNK